MFGICVPHTLMFYTEGQHTHVCICVALQDELKSTAKQLGEVKAQLGATKAMVSVTDCRG